MDFDKRCCTQVLIEVLDPIHSDMFYANQQISHLQPQHYGLLHLFVDGQDLSYRGRPSDIGIMYQSDRGSVQAVYTSLSTHTIIPCVDILGYILYRWLVGTSVQTNKANYVDGNSNSVKFWARCLVRNNIFSGHDKYMLFLYF